MANIFAKQTLSNTNGWQDRHAAAIKQPRATHGEAIGVLIQAWELYARGYKAQYPDSPLGSDYVLGEAWKAIGCELRTLLNGSCGRLDCGTLDGFILDTMREAGVDTEAL